MPTLSTTDHIMLEEYWRMRASGQAVNFGDIELVDATEYPFNIAYDLIHRRLNELRASVDDWQSPWQPMVHIVKDKNSTFAYAIKGCTDVDWIFLSSKLVEDLQWYAGNIGIKCALALAEGGRPSVDLVAECEQAVFEATLSYYLEHELAHHLDGHLGCRKAVPLNPGACQTLELAADTIAFEKLIQGELARMRQNITTPDKFVGAILASTLTFLAVLPPMRSKTNSTLASNRNIHPNSAFRQLIGLSMWTRALSDEIGMDAIEMTLNGAQVVICAFLERSSEPNRKLAESWRDMLGKRERLPFLRDADLRRVLYDPHIHAYADAMADRYDRLSPTLDRFRRGQVDNPSSKWRFL